MVATPWGDSEKLRGRRLPPGRATPAEEVAENQRARIFAATVASVAEIGYRATGVSEISEISGVSTRSFYNLFPGGKEECFLLVVEQILEGTLAALSKADEGEEDWERRIAAIYRRFARMVAVQPATASLALTEAHAAGPAAAKMLERATRSLERLSRELIEESPERAGMPAAMAEAQVGALQELARTRIREGSAETFPDMVPELVSLVASYRPPPQRLRLGDRRPPLQADGIASSEISERAIRGFVLAVAEHGYSGATIRQISRLGQMGIDTFYATFPDKRSVLLAAIDTSTAQMQAIAMAAYRRSPGWATGVRAAIAGALGFLAARPATANLLLAEIYAGGPEALALRAEGVGALVGILEERARQNPEVPPVAPEAIVGGIIALARRRLLAKGAEGLPSLAPIATYLALAPYVGAEEACAVANGDGRPSPGDADRSEPATSPKRRTKWVVQGMLGSRWATAEELAGELGSPDEEIAGYLEELEEDELVERITPADGDGAPEWTGVKQLRAIDGEDWGALTDGERREIASIVAKLIASDIDEGLRSGSFGQRLDEHHTRLLLELDQEGWTELAEAHRVAFEASKAIQVKSERRLRESGGKGIVGRSMQVLFELPQEE
jgi:AcrR family transcriptional regulator